MGKGTFNIFVGLLLLVDTSDGSTKVMDNIAGYAIIASGCIFIFLSKIKNMKDEDIHRAISVMAAKDKATATE